MLTNKELKLDHDKALNPLEGPPFPPSFSYN